MEKFPANIFWSSRRLQDIFKTCLRDVFKTSWRHVLKTSWRHVSKMSWVHVLKMSVKRLGDQQNVFWSYLYLTNVNMYLTYLVFHKSISDESKVNPKCINYNPIISTFALFWNSSSISILRIKISLVTVWFVKWMSWIQIRHCRTGEAIKARC